MDTATQDLENDHVFIILLTDVIQGMVEKQSTDTGHFDKENNVLFRMADESFSNAEQQKLVMQFAEIENNVGKEFNPENSKLKIETLAGIYLQ